MPHASARRALIAAGAALLLAAVPLHAATLYKWVDEKGVTHYTETPPEGRKATPVELKGVTSDAPPKEPDWKQREIDLRRQRIEKNQAEERDRARAERAAADRKNRCIRAQRALLVLQQQRPTYTVDERGEKSYMDDAERRLEAERWARERDAHCDAR